MANTSANIAKSRSTDQGFAPTFESNWGHRLLLGISILLAVASLLILVYCIIQYFSAATVDIDGVTYDAASIYRPLYTLGIVGGILGLPPAAVGIYISRRPKHGIIAFGAAVIAIAIVVAVAVIALFMLGASVFMTLQICIGLIILPVAYLVASIKIVLSSSTD